MSDFTAEDARRANENYKNNIAPGEVSKALKKINGDIKYFSNHSNNKVIRTDLEEATDYVMEQVKKNLESRGFNVQRIGTSYGFMISWEKEEDINEEVS